MVELPWWEVLMIDKVEARYRLQCAFRNHFWTNLAWVGALEAQAWLEQDAYLTAGWEGRQASLSHRQLLNRVLELVQRER